MTAEQPIVRPSEPTLHKITVAEFLALDEAGFFEERRVELIDGEIYEMSPLHMGHGRVSAELAVAVGLALRAFDGFEFTMPVSTELDQHSLLEADMTIVRKGAGDRLLSREYVQIVVEISATSLRYDLGRKLQLYARSGVPEYWVADVVGRRIIRFHAPAGEAYSRRAEFAFGDAVPAATITGLVVDTSRLA